MFISIVGHSLVNSAKKEHVFLRKVSAIFYRIKEVEILSSVKMKNYMLAKSARSKSPSLTVNIFCPKTNENLVKTKKIFY